MEFPKTSGIYLITNTVNGLCYVGQSQDMRRRKDTHIRELNRNAHCNRHLQSSWNKYGADAFEFTVLTECPVEKLNDEEVYYIAELGTFVGGYNMNAGGGANTGYKHTEETKRKLSEGHADVSGEKNPMFGHTVQEYMTDEEVALWKSHIAESMTGAKNHFYGKVHTEGTRQKMSEARKGKLTGKDNPMYGKTHSADAVAKIQNALKEFYANNRGANNCNAVGVVCLNTREEFGSIADACTKYGIGSSCISACCSDDAHLSAGELDGVRLVWAYKSDYALMDDKMIDKKIARAQNSRSGANNSLSKAVICLTTGEIFGSAREAAKHYGLDYSTICKCCRGQNKSCGKHNESGEKLRWAFYEGDNANHEEIREVAETK